MPTKQPKYGARYRDRKAFKTRRLLKGKQPTAVQIGESSDSESGQDFEDALDAAVGDIYPDGVTVDRRDGVPRDSQGHIKFPPALPKRTRSTTANQAAQNPAQPTATTSGITPFTFRLPAPAPSAPPEPQIPIVNVIPSLDHIEPYKDGNSFDDYIERWEMLMARYNCTSEQLALALPVKLSGSAWETYKTIVKLHPEYTRDFDQLKIELSAAFKIETPLQEKNLWAITQGKKTVNDFYAEIVAAGRAVFKDMPEVNRNQVITSAFVGGLRESYQRAILKQGEVTLQQALKEARNLEAIDRAVAKNKVMAVTAVTHEPTDPLEPLTKQIEGLTRLVNEQNRRMQQNDEQAGPSQPRSQYQVFHQPRGYNSNYNTNYKPRFNQYNKPRNNFNQYRNPDTRYTYRPRADMGNNYRPAFQPRNENRPDDKYRQTSYRAPGGYRDNSTPMNGQPYCRACQRRHPSRRCPTVNNIDTPEPTHTMTNVNREEMTPTEFANFYLTQPPEEINNVASSSVEPTESQPKPGQTYNRSTNGRKLGITEQLQLTLICLTACFVGTTASFNWHPDNPMICGTEMKHSPQIFRIRQQYNCTSSIKNQTNMEPQEVELMVYQKNMIKMESTAYQCTKSKTVVTTQMSFFGDIKTKDETTETRPITAAECTEMVTRKRCDAGKLKGGDGVYVTDNPVNAVYKYCCKKHTFSADQCSFIEAFIYKRHGVDTFESTAGDVSHCTYESGSCALNDESMLIWEDNPTEKCEYTPSFKVKGDFLGTHFVSNERDLALTFYQYGLSTYKDCNNTNITRSDQGLMVRFLTPLANITVNKTIASRDKIIGPAPAALFNAALQAIEYRQTKLSRQLFWTSYDYACQNLAETLRLVTMLLEEHPTTTARYLLRRPEVIAKSGPGFLQVFPCTMLNSTQYEILPMENNCTEFIPVQIWIAGTNKIGYLNPKNNVVTPHTFAVNCASKENTLLRINGVIVSYNLNGTLTPVKTITNLSLPDINLGSQPLEIKEVIFSRLHRISWSEEGTSNLNQLFSTLDRQRAVLKEIGIHSSRHNTMDKNAIESREELLGGAFFSFLFGGHVGSGYELWTFFCNLLFSCLLAMSILGCILKKFCLPRLRRNEVIANIDIESMDDSNGEIEDDTPATNRLISDEEISVPPSYRLYPSLPTITEEERCKQAWREYLRLQDCQNLEQETVAVIHQPGEDCRKTTIGIKLNGKICTSALVDAGATISLIRTDVATRLGLVMEKSQTTATGVTKDTLDIIGQTHAELTIENDWCDMHKFYLANDISYPVILGTDLLSKIGSITYDFQKCTLHLNNGQGIQMGDQSAPRSVRTCNTIEIPPFTEMAIVAQVNKTTNSEEYIFEGNKNLARHILIGKSVNKIQQGKLVIPVMNPTNKPYVIQKDEIVGNVESLENDLELLNVHTESNHHDNETALPGDKLKLEDTDLTVEQFKVLQDLVNEFHDIAGEGITQLGRTSIVQHVVEILPGVSPIRSKAYNIPVGLRAEIKQQIDQMQEKGLITPSSGRWTSPVVLVRKKDGGWRFCVDYRKLNAVTVKQSMAISSIQSAVEIMHGKKYFSSIDLCSGFFQIQLHEDSREKSGFITPFGCYEFTVTPQGMAGSPATFTRLALAIMADLISDGSSCVYLDDWLMTSKTFEDHIRLLRTVFTRLKFAGLKYRPSKSQLCKKEILYLGHIISGNGIAVAPHNVAKIKDFPTPTTRTEVKRLLGLFGYYRIFIKGFAKIAAPIIKLTSNDVNFVWTPECDQAAETLKEQITSAPILAFPDFEKTFTLTTDASATAIGAVLSQKQEDGRDHPVSFYSKTLDATQRKWDSCEQELFAIVEAVKHFRCYLMNVRFKIFTDNAACTYILKKPELSPRLARWAIQLAEYDFEVQHKEGQANKVADALSRAIVATTEDEPDCLDTDMRNAQKKDFYLGPIWRYVVKSKFPKDAKKARQKEIITESEHFTARKEVLYRRQGDRLVLAIPAAQRPLLLYAIHDSITAMHPGVTKTLQRLRDLYWFPRMTYEVEEYISRCTSCQQRKNPQKQTRVPLGTQLATSPFEVLSIDFQGPFVESEDGMKHILVFTDHFTKWCEMVPTPDQLATTVARVYVENVFCRFGASKILLSDRAKNFTSELIADINEILGVDHRLTTPYHPQCNGQVEIYNKSIANMLSHFVKENHKDWPRYVPFCQLAHNSSKHTALQVSPSALLMCREMRLPYDLTKPTPTIHTQPDDNYVAKLHERMTEVWAKTREDAKKSKDKQKRYYDKTATTTKLQTGDYVLYHDKRGYRNKTSKLIKRWKGPYVIKSMTDTTASIQPIDKPDQTPVTVHLNNLKLHTGPYTRGDDSDLSIDLDSDSEQELKMDDQDENEDKRTEKTSLIPENTKENPLLYWFRCGSRRIPGYTFLTPERYYEIFADRLTEGKSPTSAWLRQHLNREASPPPRRRWYNDTDWQSLKLEFGGDFNIPTPAQWIERSTVKDLFGPPCYENEANIPANANMFGDFQSEGGHESTVEQPITSDKEEPMDSDDSQQAPRKSKTDVKKTETLTDTNDLPETNNGQPLTQITDQLNPPPAEDFQQTRKDAGGRYALRRKPKKKREAEYEYSS